MVAESPEWVEAAIGALDSFQKRTGRRPSEAVLSEAAFRQLRECNAGIRPTEYLFGFPIVVDPEIDGVYFR